MKKAIFMVVTFFAVFGAFKWLLELMKEQNVTGADVPVVKSKREYISLS